MCECECMEQFSEAVIGAVYMGKLARLAEMIPSRLYHAAGSPRRDLAISLSTRVYMRTWASPPKRDLRVLKVHLYMRRGRSVIYEKHVYILENSIPATCRAGSPSRDL